METFTKKITSTMYSKILSIAFLVGLTLTSVAGVNEQVKHDISKKERKELFFLAEDLMYDFKYNEALTVLLQLDSTKETAKSIYDYHIGVCYVSVDITKAGKYLLKAHDEMNRVPFFVHYYLGRSFEATGNYKLALQHYTSYNELLNRSKIVFSYELIDEKNAVQMEKTHAHMEGHINRVKRFVNQQYIFSMTK